MPGAGPALSTEPTPVIPPNNSFHPHVIIAESEAARSHGDTAYKWFMSGNDPTLGRGSLVGLEKPGNQLGTGGTDPGERVGGDAWLLCFCLERKRHR